MAKKLTTYPGEFASVAGLLLMSLATPFLIEPTLPGSLAIARPVAESVHWVYSWAAGFCGCAALVQTGALVQSGTWPGARLWSCRLAMVASFMLLCVFAPIRFYGSSVTAIVLLIVNALSTLGWEVRSPNPTGHDA